MASSLWCPWPSSVIPCAVSLSRATATGVAGVRHTNFLRRPDGCNIAFQLLPQHAQPHSQHPAAPRTPPAAAPNTPLLMIMGLSGTKEDWRGLDVQFAQDRPVLILDNRGIGESDVPKTEWTMEQMADDAIAVAQHCFPSSTINVMGISMGGMIAQALVLRAPKLVDRLILGCTRGMDGVDGDPAFLAAFPEMASLPKDRLREGVRKLLTFNYTDKWIAENGWLFDQLVDESMQTKRSGRGVFQQLGAIMGFFRVHQDGDDEHDAKQAAAGPAASGDEKASKRQLRINQRRDQLRALNHLPVLLIHGDEDRVIPAENSTRLASCFAHSFVALLPGVGHIFWNMDHGTSYTVAAAFLAQPVQHLLTQKTFSLPPHPQSPAARAGAAAAAGSKASFPGVAVDAPDAVSLRSRL